MPFWAGDTDLRQVVSSQFRGAFSLYRAVYRAPPVGGSRLRRGRRHRVGAARADPGDRAGAERVDEEPVVLLGAACVAVRELDQVGDELLSPVAHHRGDGL